jgi:hypothetical protein
MEQTIVPIKFRGIDDWNRPVYKHAEANIYFGITNILFPDKNLAPNNTTEEINEYFRNNIDQLEYFGMKFNCEPHGGLPEQYKLNIID